MRQPETATMVATVGGQPQVVTFALDALLAQAVPVRDLILLYLSPDKPRLHNALQKVRTELSNGRYADHALTYRFIPICAGTIPLSDIQNEADANATWETVHRLIAELKAERRTLHICISGGRRLLGLLTMSAAMLHFGHQDQLWHMYTPDELRQAANEGAIMHLPPGADGFRLIRVPMMPWGSYFPALRQLAQPVLAGDVLARPRRMLDEMEARRCRQVVDRLTERQREALRAFAQGLTPQAVAAQLFITIKTVDSHKTVILAECRNAWALPEEAWLDYRFLAEKFERFFG
jgi:CRISPR-associated protein Csx14